MKNNKSNRINANSYYIVVEENQILNNQGQAVQLLPPTDYLEFYNNTISGNNVNNLLCLQ
jgi:hypothetical protein